MTTLNNNPSKNSQVLKTIAHQLFEIGAIRFGDFQLKSGIHSPFYIDLRVIISYPKLLKSIAKLFAEKMEKLNFASICGVPYTALPIACALSLNQNIPMLIKRKEAKDYGTKKIIEGAFKQGDNCLIIEDLITSGISIIETKRALEKEGLKVTDAIVLIDRGQGGNTNLVDENIDLHAVFHISEVLKSLEQLGNINLEQRLSVLEFIEHNQIKIQ